MKAPERKGCVRERADYCVSRLRLAGGVQSAAQSTALRTQRSSVTQRQPCCRQLSATCLLVGVGVVVALCGRSRCCKGNNERSSERSPPEQDWPKPGEPFLCGLVCARPRWRPASADSQERRRDAGGDGGMTNRANRRCNFLLVLATLKSSQWRERERGGRK